MASESVEGSKGEPSPETSDSAHPRLVALRSVSWRLLTSTVGTCFRYRVTGLAAEAAFFAVLSLPPLIFGLAGSIYFIVRRVDPDQIDYLRERIIELSGQVLTQESVHKVVVPTVNRVLQEPRFDVVSVGFVLALWSGSRALNVFVDTITIMYGLGGRRGIVRTRMLSFTLYVIGLVVGVIVLPLVLAGPRLVDKALPESADLLNPFYWPTVIVLSIAFLDHALSPVRPGPDLVALRRPWRGAGVRHLGVGQLPAAGHPGVRADVDLRPVGCAYRGAALALPDLAGGADRGRGQHGIRPGVPRAVDLGRASGAAQAAHRSPERRPRAAARLRRLERRRPGLKGRVGGNCGASGEG